MQSKKKQISKTKSQRMDKPTEVLMQWFLAQSKEARDAVLTFYKIQNLEGIADSFAGTEEPVADSVIEALKMKAKDENNTIPLNVNSLWVALDYSVGVFKL